MVAADRALLALLCGLALLSAASLLPAAGVGTHPTAGGSTAGPTDDPGPDDRMDQPADAPTSTDAPGDATPTEPSPPTATATTTPTPTETPTEGASDGTGPPLLPVAAFVGSVALVVLAWRAGDLAADWNDSPAGGTGGSGSPTNALGRIRLGFGRLFGRASRGTLAFVVGVSASAPRLFDATAVAFREASIGIALAGASLPRPGRLLDGFARSLAVGTLGLGGLLGSLSGAFSRSRGGTRRGRATRTDARERAPSPADDDPAPSTIEDAWRAMATAVPVENRASRTPTEVARAAVEAGLPGESVRRLTRTFQEVAYGGRPRTDRRRRRAFEAFERLQRSGEGRP